MSKPLSVTIPHRLGAVAAKSRIQGGFDQVHALLGSYGATVEGEWTEDQMVFRAAALGQTLTGRLDVYEDSVQVEVDLPWMLSLLSGKIQDHLQRHGTALLEKK